MPPLLASEPYVLTAGAYLDTSVIRAYSINDIWLKHASAHTSVLTIFELLDGCTSSQEQYQSRQAALRKLLDLGIRICPHMPMQVVMRAFDDIDWDWHQSPTSQFDLLIELVAAMLHTKSACEFAVYLQHCPDWLALQSAYSGFVRGVIGPFAGQTREVRNAFGRAPATDITTLGLEPEGSAHERMKDFTHTPHVRRLSLTALVHSIAVTIGQDDQTTRQRILESYNQMAWPYICAVAVSLMGRMSRGEQPQQNDVFDLEHFAYLEPSVLLVSNDRRMRTLAIDIGLSAVDGDAFRVMAQDNLAERNIAWKDEDIRGGTDQPKQSGAESPT